MVVGEGDTEGELVREKDVVSVGNTGGNWGTDVEEDKIVRKNDEKSITEGVRAVFSGEMCIADGVGSVVEYGIGIGIEEVEYVVKGNFDEYIAGATVIAAGI